MNPESDPTFQAIQRVTSTFGVESESEAVPAPGTRQERLLSYAEADRLASFLEGQGCYLLAELPQHVSAAERAQLRHARQAVEQYVRTSGDHRAAALSRLVHTFDVAAAATPHEARGLLDKYDDLHPHEDPAERTRRKQTLMDRWCDTQVLRQHAEEDHALASEVAGPDCQLPEEFRVRAVDHSVVAVSYDTVEDALRGLTHYRDTAMVDPPDNAVAGGPGEIRYGKFYTFPTRHGGVEMMSEDRYALFGVSAMERYAHVTGQDPQHTNEFIVGIQCPMPTIQGHGENARPERVRVPEDEILRTLANVTGLQQIARAERTNGGQCYDLPGGGIIQITGSGYNYADGTVGAEQKRYTHDFRPPSIKVNIQLGMGASNEVLDRAAKRLSAWMALQAARTGQKPGLTDF